MTFRYCSLSGCIDITLKTDNGKFRKGCHWIYLNALQLNSNPLLFFDRAVLGLSELVRQCHILQLQMFQDANMGHLSSLWETKTTKLSCEPASPDRCLDDQTGCISINLTCMLAISLCSRTLASCARASCCWYHCLTCWSESISAWEVFSRLWRVLRSSWTCWSWLWRPPICWRKSWTATCKIKTSHFVQ